MVCFGSWQSDDHKIVVPDLPALAEAGDPGPLEAGL
jgi:hypothetical protein